MTEETKVVLRKGKWIHGFIGYLPNSLNFSGVYLLSFPNGKWYVGSSKNLGERLASHLKELNREKPSVHWYSQAQKENSFPILSREAPPIEPKEPIFVPPKGDPRLELAKDGRPKGKRASKKAVNEYLEKCKAPYLYFLLEKEEWKKRYDKWRQDYADWDYKRIKWWELPRCKYLTIHYCKCDNYREFEDEILKSIEDKNNWYNSQFIVYKNRDKGELE